MNTSMPIVLLTIANSDGVHVLSRYFKELRRSKDSKIAILDTMGNLFVPIFCQWYSISKKRVDFLISVTFR